MSLMTKFKIFLARELGFEFEFKVLVASPGNNPYFASMVGLPNPKAEMVILADENNSPKIVVFDHMLINGNVFQFDSTKGRTTIRIIE